MKKIFITVLIVISLLNTNAQNFSFESSFQAKNSSFSTTLQKLQVSGDKFSIRYEYRPDGRDVLGIVFPKIWKNNSTDINLVIGKLGNHDHDDRFAVDIWINKKLSDNLMVMVDAGRLVGKNGEPWDFIGSMISSKTITAEGYFMPLHPMIGGKEKGGPSYYWLAYHPEKCFFSFGKKEQESWFLAGTRNLDNFGSFTFANYNPKTGNFWFKSQNGFGEINQGFFSLETYKIAAEYLVVPLFFHKHFSPIISKGTYALKVEGRRTAGIYNFEVMGSKRLTKKDLGIALGLNSEYKNFLTIAPSFEAYKTWKVGNYSGVFELRYDMVYSSLSGYLVIRY